MPPQDTENQELLRQKQYYEALLQVSPAAIVAIDPHDVVTLWNPAAERLFGYTAQEAVGRNVDDLVATDPEVREEARELNRTAQGGSVRKITRRTRKDGSLVDVELLGAPIQIGGEIVGRYAIYLDISELQRRKLYYEALVELSPTAITTVNRNDIVTSWNPAAEKLFGYSAAEAIGRNIDDLVANRDDIRDEGVRVSDEIAERSVRLTTRRTRKDGSLVDVDVTAAPIRVGGELVGKYALYHDITELQRQKQWYESALQISQAAIVTIDRAGTITSWNPAAEELFGYTAEEAIGQELDDLVARTPEVAEEARQYTRRGLEGHRDRAITRRTRKDGSLVDVDMMGAAVWVGGEVAGDIVIYHDITELQRQKRYHESVLQLSPAAIVTVDEQFRVTSWNRAAEKLFGYAAEEARGKLIDDLVADSDEVREDAARMNEAGFRGEQVRSISRRTRKDGSLVDVEIVAGPVIVGDLRVGHVVIYHDISEIQRQRRYYESLVEVSPTAVVLMTNDGSITSWSPAAERLFGYTPEEAIGKNIDDVVATDPAIREEAEAYLRRAQETGSIQAVTRRTRKDGSFVEVQLLAAPVVIGGERVGFYVLYHDIGPLQQARRDAEAAARATSAFLATMSHEIRTPLNAVIGMTGLLLDTALNAEQRSYGEVIRSSGDALLGVINEILDFSKIEAGRLDLERQPFRVRQCVESALELVAGAAADKGLELAYMIDPRTPGSIVGDFTRLRQILLNLLNNAVKFTDEGEVVLKVEATRLGPSRDGGAGSHEIHFVVQDTGIGIPEERMDRLFEAFSQVDASTTRRYGGTGLGLAISRRLAEEMGGRMWAESRLSKGSTFHVAITAEAVSGPVSADEPEAVPQLADKRVLIVDDNATNREILRRQAESWGMTPREAASPIDALELVRRGEPFDVAILDMQMPEMDGVALAEEIRRHRDSGVLPLIMLTSLGRRETTPAGVDFAAHLTKPVRPSQLYDALIGLFAPQLALRPVPRPEVRPAPPAEERPQMRILVAEDNAVNQRVATLVLEKLGYRADVAADGREAIEALERQPYDVVLMDVQMPEIDGLEATRRIRERWPDGGPRIIAMTAGATEGDREACLAAGMDDYVSKPVRQEELAAALVRWGPTPNVPDTGGEETDSVIDPDALDQLRRTVGGEDALGEVLTTFLEDTERLLGELRRDVEDGRSGEVRRHAHSLKSTAASFGASRLSELCRRLEEHGRTGRLEDTTTLVEDIAAEFARVREALRPGSLR